MSGLNPQSDEESGGQHFGVRVGHLVSDKNPVPMVLEMMLEHVEMQGLYTEGIYRKSGSANRMKELHQRLETGNVYSSNFIVWNCETYYLKANAL